MFYLSTWLFYVASVFLAVTCFGVAALTFLPGGITGKVEQTRLQQRLSAGFFATLGLFYGDLAMHAIRHEAVFDHRGRLDWDLTSLLCLQAILIFAALFSINREKRKLRRQHRL